ncbi:unnamed protein product [Fusarium graminearum]|uniref:Chromosome 2, complete genome n=2 Tax=Gibberella zeae TaxID=5518 RepID=I1S647_GIBZE|nr:hypothetical protein FGSG_12318 [Fusarium graminearum PH-1]EYB32455.1 hypothetical protein FG05_12318 [Fusarium graminearum]ESU09084.1 hypothetical protein FGSG_12318 [Fusarium graminearum PH-1]CAG1986102.1 unnamed protein product [Fusarium graminearum]CAG1994756.1 unnamed protein product [Fusarium graminearum]CAG1998552.1 unnamed protein product [Fusarium graminearum]|eukprot:XP_011321583.1 hypothetical protein FGSG_12318 [Fusarium graminearum PH-1]
MDDIQCRLYQCIRRRDSCIDNTNDRPKKKEEGYVVPNGMSNNLQEPSFYEKGPFRRSDPETYTKSRNGIWQRNYIKMKGMKKRKQPKVSCLWRALGGIDRWTPPLSHQASRNP